MVLILQIVNQNTKMASESTMDRKINTKFTCSPQWIVMNTMTQEQLDHMESMMTITMTPNYGKKYVGTCSLNRGKKH